MELKVPTEVYSRVCGFFRPVQQYNPGKKEEFRERKTYKVNMEVLSGPKFDSIRKG